MYRIKQKNGFTLIEMMLVMVIIGILAGVAIRYFEERSLQQRMSRMTMQMQQILNASLSYYVDNSSWPSSIDCLQGTGVAPCLNTYLQKNTTAFNSPWGIPYQIVSTPQLFYVIGGVTQSSTTTQGTAAATATVVGNTLPLAYLSSDPGTPSTDASPGGVAPLTTSNCTAGTSTCYIAASINIPIQNLNHAGATSYAGLYKHGGCVPVPTCPVDATGQTMTPEIFLLPVSVSGVNDVSAPQEVYPISSFTAYATKDGSTLDATPYPCTIGGSPPPATGAVCDSTDSTPMTTGKYWRACLQVNTEKGDVSQTNTQAWGNYVTILAITRCAINNEPIGSDFTVYTQ